MPRLGGDVPYRLMGAGQPTISCSRDANLTANPQSQEHSCASAIFNGVGDGARLPMDEDLGITNEFTINLWVQGSNLSSASLTQTIYEIHELDEATDDNAFSIIVEPDAPGFGLLNFRLFNSSGTLIQRYRAKADVFLGQNNQWNMVTCTWNGTVLSFYRNGTNKDADMTIITNISGDQTNTPRSMSMGSKVDFTDFFAGRFHQVGLWDRVLAEEEIRTIWNQGAGSKVNLQIGHDDYDGQDDLRAWYRLGKDPRAPVADFSGNGYNMAEFVVEEIMPTGVILPFGSDTPPAGFLLCDGSEIDRGTFAALFAVIGENYGAGNGSTTFNLPNLQGRFPQGKDTGDTSFDALGELGGTKEQQLAADQLPIHFHFLLGGGGGDDTDPLNNTGPTSADGIGGIGTDPGPAGFGRGVRENRGDDASATTLEEPVDMMSPFVVVNYIIQT